MFCGGCEKRGVVTFDIVFVISPHWDVLNAIACTFILDTVSGMGIIPSLGVCHYTYILPAN